MHSRIAYHAPHPERSRSCGPILSAAPEKEAKIHFPFYLRFGAFSLHPHLPFELLAYAVGFLAFRRLRGATGDSVSDASRWTVITAAVAGAALGSRILYWFEDPALTFAHWRNPAYLLGGKTIVGALIGGLFAVEWAKRRIGETHSTGDLFAAPLALGIAIGRIGCFLTGLSDDTYGVPTALPWGVDFGDGIRRHPTQLYESIFALALFLFLLRVLKRPHRQGDVFKAFMVAYLGWRLAIDFLKPEVRIGIFSGIQWACAAMFVYYSRDILRWLSGPKTLETESTLDALPSASSHDVRQA
ncbi:MAG: prolipoprotein diacylglyceryl transferase family protein [Candidatus Acidiferrales bacterium]